MTDNYLKKDRPFGRNFDTDKPKEKWNELEKHKLFTNSSDKVDHLDVFILSLSIGHKLGITKPLSKVKGQRHGLVSGTGDQKHIWLILSIAAEKLTDDYKDLDPLLEAKDEIKKITEEYANAGFEWLHQKLIIDDEDGVDAITKLFK